MSAWQLHAPYAPAGDQPAAIAKLVAGFRSGKRAQTLLGVTGSGKTFTVASVVRELGLPVLVVSHNKTLAAQLYAEFKAFFPENAVEYFVSYYDYYQPEAYLPQTDTYIEKDAAINEDLDRLRLAATSAVSSRPDTLVVASVSCLYGLGSPADYAGMQVTVAVGEALDRTELLRRLVAVQYARNEIEFRRGTFRVRGGVVDLWPAYAETAVRVELAGDEVAGIAEVDPLTGEVLRESARVSIFPAKHFVLPAGRVETALAAIEAELAARLIELRDGGKLLEAQRLESRTKYDLELLREVGYCPGIENYSRQLAGRAPGERPFCLFDYFPREFLVVVDESHVTLPQVRGMYRGDQARKATLVEHGFRLPSALDNRPMRFEEFEVALDLVLFVSATPSEYEIQKSGGEVIEQLVRPTGLLDPPITVRPAEGQVADLLAAVREHAARQERVLVTTLTKRLAEDLAAHFREAGLNCRYLHSELDAFERVEILRDLRQGEFDVLIGVNLLREGLDLPEVALVAVLDADKEGFLRSKTSLIQTIGRTARNVNGQVLLYAEKETEAIRQTLAETGRRREAQLEYNRAHGITPRSIVKEFRAGILEILGEKTAADGEAAAGLDGGELGQRLARAGEIGELEAEMYRLAEALRFEEAARVRDRILELQGRAAEAAAGRQTPRPGEPGYRAGRMRRKHRGKGIPKWRRGK